MGKPKIDREGSPEGALTSPERQELTQLRRELKRVEMERDFLKKVATFFAKDNTPTN
jgi:transposase